MKCPQCGAETTGDVCECGATVAPNAIGDWREECRYDLLMQRDDVRDQIARHAAQAKKRASAEVFLATCDRALAGFSFVSTSKIMEIALPWYKKLGIQTGKTRRETVNTPIGTVIVAALCSLARQGFPVDAVEQGEDGCLIKAEIPSDMWTFGGNALVTIQREDNGVSVEAATVIRGQKFDWGKSKRFLSALFDDIRQSSV